MSVGENVKFFREKKDMKQVELAKQVNVAQATICQIEKGIKNPSLQLADEIARVLGVKLEKLLRRDA